MIPELSVLECNATRISDFSPLLVWGCNFSIRKEVLLAAGGFHPDALPQELGHLRGDGESHLADHLCRQGWRTVFHPGATVLHQVSAERMTFDYLCQRRRAQGISDSFTLLRRFHRHDESRLLHRLAGPRAALQMAVSRLKSLRLALGGPQTPLRGLRRAMLAAYREGFRCHQQRFRDDPRLRQWVLRPDYLDATLPPDEAPVNRA